MFLRDGFANCFTTIMRAPANRWRLILGVLAVIAFTLLWIRLPSSPNSTHPLHFTPEVVYQIPTEQPPVPHRLLPYRYWDHRASYPEFYNQVSCTKLPTADDIHYAAAAWQYLKVENGSVYVYSAYWDNRFEEPLVRVLVYCDVAPLPTLHCQLWYPNDNAPMTVATQVQYGWREEWGGPTTGVNEPYVLACKARRHKPDPQIPPVAVSLVTEPCEHATNILNVQGAPFPDDPSPTIERGNVSNASIGVCLKWVDYRLDVSTTLVEWIQLIRHFGAKTLYAHVVHMHPNVRKVFDYYTSIGFAKVTSLAHPPQLSSISRSPGAIDFQDMRRELLPLNDCLYRALRHHDLIAAIDIDEIIVPVRDGTWQALVEQDAKENKPADALVFANYYFLDGAQKDKDAPPPARILAHMWRARKPNPPGYNVKSFHNTSTVVAMHNHMPMSCGEKWCECRDINHTVGRLHHYRGKCADDEDQCEALLDVVRDDTMRRWRYVTNETTRILAEIGIPAA